MPAIIKVKVINGRDLPVMDRASDLTDAFVELRLGSTSYKTEVCRKSLNPQWDSEWFKFEVDDEEMQEENLQVKVLDYDVYSSHDAIGKVNINLDIFALKVGSHEMSGVFPIYDTLHGIRGHIRLKVKVQFFMDTNKYRQTSCGVQFFSVSCVPHGFNATLVQGLVDELLVNDDPEYQWIDKIRTPRASNEARQRLFSKLSGEVKRKIGIKVLELGGNAVIGYQQLFDLEGVTGIVIRAIGTSVTLIRDSDNINNLYVPSAPNLPSPESSSELSSSNLAWRTQRSIDGTFTEWYSSSTSSEVEHTNKVIFTIGDSIDGNGKLIPPSVARGLSMKVDQQQYPFFTFTTPPPGFVVHLGGIVTSRSVKLLDKINKPDDSETRDSWWNELRMELRSHAKAMGCHAVVGYSEYTSICDDLIVLSVYGTAVVIKQDEEREHEALDCDDCDDNIFTSRKQSVDSSSTNSSITGGTTNHQSCYVCHIPYSDVELPLPITFSRCAFCRQGKVPDVLFTTIDIPDDVPITGSGCMIQARVIRCRKKEKGEIDAENVSQILPFLEFDLHQQLINKLKLKGMNSIFGMKTKLCIGEQVIVGIMTGTAVFLTALPPPPMLTVSIQKGGGESCNKGLGDIQKKLMEMNKRNLQFHNIKDAIDLQPNLRMKPFISETIPADIKNEKLDFFADGKDTFVLEVDDKSDANILPLLSDTNYEGFNIFNTQSTPGFPLLQHGYQYLSVFNRVKVPILVDDDLKITHWLSHICDGLIMGIRLKTRMMRPCCLTKISFDIDIDDDDNFQLTISTFATKIDERSNRPNKKRSLGSRSMSSQSETSNDIVNIEEKDVFSKQSSSKSCTRLKVYPGSHSPVIICPLDNVPNSQVVSYIGNISLFLIRESMSVKEDGGLDLFMQQFMNEIHSIIRSHVIALAGNAILSFSLNEIILYYNTHKNQAQCLINVSGDAACIKRIIDTGCNPLPCTASLSESSSINSSPVTSQTAELLGESKHKLERAVFGTNV